VQQLLGERLEAIQWLGVAIVAVAIAAIALPPGRAIRPEPAVAPRREPASPPG